MSGGNEASGRHTFRKPEMSRYDPRPNTGWQPNPSAHFGQQQPAVMMGMGRGAMPPYQSPVMHSNSGNGWPMEPPNISHSGNERQMEPQNRSHSGNGRQREPRDRSHSGGRKRSKSRSAERKNAKYSSNSSFDNSFSPQNYRGKQDDITFLSRTLSSILRHNAGNFGLKLMPGGFIYVDEILHKVRKLYGYTLEDVNYVVASNDKQRFTLAFDNERMKIRANQGHTMEVEDLDLQPITSADDYPTVIHGTYMEAWEKIKKTGLKRMKRNHIHFAPGTPGANGVISGMRSSCEVMIYLNLEKALKGGLKFFVSSNNVILSPGDANGVIHPRYFFGAKERYYGSRLPFDPEIDTKSAKKNKDNRQSKDGKRKQEQKDKRSKEDKEQDKVQAADGNPPTKADAKEQTHSTSHGQVQSTSVDKGVSGDIPDPRGSDEVDEMEPRVEEADSKRLKLEEKTPSEDKPCNSEALKSIDDNYSDKDSKKEDEEEVTMEPVMIDDPEISKVTVNELIDSKPSFVVVIHFGENLGEENGRLHRIAVGTRKELYVFNLEKNTSLMNDGQLKELLMNKEITKVFCGIQAISSSLIMEYDILMNGIPIWDIEILHDKLSGKISEMDKNTIKEMGFVKKYFKKRAKKSEQSGTISEDMEEMKQQAAIMMKMYPILQKQMSDLITKDLKRETYDTAIPMEDGADFLREKIKKLKLEMKEKEKKGKAETKKEDQASIKGKGVAKAPCGKSKNKSKKK